MEHAAPTPVPETLPNPNLHVMPITLTADFPVLGHVPGPFPVCLSSGPILPRGFPFSLSSTWAQRAMCPVWGDLFLPDNDHTSFRSMGETMKSFYTLNRILSIFQKDNICSILNIKYSTWVNSENQSSYL